ncbi:DMT family transporter [Lentimicrobium sp. L6]|uniref:DMT family transporter n=1 Tax=Lentimicrobium sp. L6 TaxID=2735916 RepID=UPI0015530BA4|nr:DMT family transporter [Lentimicrobium sp. L6]NPD85176.1 DMT family transporter [Lentimicrobium sp. L6]
MKLQDTTKGYLFAFIAVFATSNVYIFSKAALGEVSLAVFGFYWFLFGLIWNSIFAAKTGKLKLIKNLKNRDFIILLILGLLEISGTTFFFLSISTFSNPAIVSFLGNINPVIVTVLGFIILRERYNKPEIFGIFLIIVGAFIISYQGGTTLSSMFVEGAEYILYSSFFYGISAIITKKNVKKLGPSILALSRNVFLFIFSFSVLMIQGLNWGLTWFALWNIFIGSILGPFLTITAGYQAYKYLEVSRVSILGSTKGIIVLIGAYVYFGKFPEIYQVAGGVISIVGVILISVGKILLKKKSYKVNA